MDYNIMAHVLSSKTFTELLLSPKRWKFVSSLFLPEVESICDAHYLRWLADPCHHHSHHQREIMISLEGAGRFALEDQIYSAEPGTIFIFNTQEMHERGYPSCLTDFTHLWVSILPDCYFIVLSIHREGDYIEASSMKMFLSVSDVGISLDGILADLREHYCGNQTCLRLRLVSALSLLTTAIVARATAPQDASATMLHRDVVSTMQQHILSSGGVGADLDNLARISGYSKYHLSRLFKKQVGHSIHEYVDISRMAKVRDLLEQEMTKTDIARQLGFSGLSSFLLWLKRQRERGNSI